jgi:hypothetical protein
MSTVTTTEPDGIGKHGRKIGSKRPFIVEPANKRVDRISAGS